MSEAVRERRDGDACGSGADDASGARGGGGSVVVVVDVDVAGRDGASIARRPQRSNPGLTLLAILPPARARRRGEGTPAYGRALDAQIRVDQAPAA